MTPDLSEKETTSVFRYFAKAPKRWSFVFSHHRICLVTYCALQPTQNKFVRLRQLTFTTKAELICSVRRRKFTTKPEQICSVRSRAFRTRAGSQRPPTEVGSRNQATTADGRL